MFFAIFNWLKPSYWSRNDKYDKYDERKSKNGKRSSYDDDDSDYKVKKNPKGTLYAFKVSRNTYKVGRSSDASKRIKQYKTLHPDGEYLHQVDCKDGISAEKVLHYILRCHGYNVDREIFRINPVVLIQYMDLVKNICNTDLDVGIIRKLNNVF